MKIYNNKDKELVARNRHDFDLFDPFKDFFGLMPIPEPEREKEFKNLMKTDVKEFDNGYELEIDMPGYDKKDINIDLNNGYLTISATKNEKTDEQDKKHKYIRKERYFGSVSRSFYVGDIKEEDVSAKLENGTLVIDLPKEKKVEEEKKRIEIK